MCFYILEAQSLCLGRFGAVMVSGVKVINNSAKSGFSVDSYNEWKSRFNRQPRCSCSDKLSTNDLSCKQSFWADLLFNDL